jgi:dTDP-4-amino-4,6-dideoxygalactose transaminase
VVTYRVPFVRPRDHYCALKRDVDAAITDTLARGDLVLRQQLRDFEARLAEYVGVKYAVGVACGYHALHLSMLACGIGPGDEVVTVAHTFVATVSAIVHCGATPVLVDVAHDHTIDVAALERAITPRTKAIVPVHLNGRVCDMDAIMSVGQARGLMVIEDAAQALGALFRDRMAGSFGRAGCFSFYPFKALGGIGDGGAITTNDPDLARSVTLLRFNGEDRDSGEYFYHGYTALLDNVQAAVLDVKLRRLPEWLGHRRRIAELYRRGLAAVDHLMLPHFPETCQSDSFQNYVVRSAHRDRLRAHLKEAGVETLVHWPTPLWCHRRLGLPRVRLPETEAICREVLSLPMSSETTENDAETTVEAIHAFVP